MSWLCIRARLVESRAQRAGHVVWSAALARFDGTGTATPCVSLDTEVHPRHTGRSLAAVYVTRAEATGPGLAPWLSASQYLAMFWHFGDSLGTSECDTPHVAPRYIQSTGPCNRVLSSFYMILTGNTYRS